MILNVPRERDEQILRLLRLRSSGHPTAEIAARVGISQQNVRVTTNTIKAADIHESGEPRKNVAAGYWP